MFVGWSLTEVDEPYGADADPDDIADSITTITAAAEGNNVCAFWAVDRNGNGTPDYDEAKVTLNYDKNGGTGIDDITNQ